VLFHDAFQTGAPGTVRQGIFLVPLKTLARRQLTRAEVPIGDLKAAVSPDGQTLAFIRSGIPGLCDVYVVPMSGGEPRRVTDWNTLVEGLAWTPDGKEIIYGVYEPIGPRLWRIPAAGSGPGRGTRLTESTGDATLPSISRPDSHGHARLAYFTRRVETSLRLVDLTHRDATGALTSSRVFQRSSRWDYGGRLSPDRHLVAFISTRTGTAEIWLSAPDGSNVRRLTDIKGDPVFPFWSSDSRLAFLSAPGRTGNKRIYIVGIEGGEPKPLTGETEVVLPGSWSRDGRWLYFMSDRSGDVQIWKMSLDRGVPVQVTRHGGFEPQESPDGQFVYYTDRPPGEPSGRENPVRLMRVPANGGDESTVLREIRTFHWTAADDGIYYYSPGPPRTILRYRPATGEIGRIGDLPDQQAVLDGDMAVSRDGRSLFMSQIERNDTDLTLIENFR
jgi:Tol biopolymer transport system component